MAFSPMLEEALFAQTLMRALNVSQVGGMPAAAISDTMPMASFTADSCPDSAAAAQTLMACPRIGEVWCAQGEVGMAVRELSGEGRRSDQGVGGRVHAVGIEEGLASVRCELQRARGVHRSKTGATSKRPEIRTP
jgi:hypothetical protein